MIGDEAEIIVGRKIQERFAADYDARRLRGIDAAQFAKQIFLAKRVEPLLKFDVKFRRQPVLKFSAKESECNEEVWRSCWCVKHKVFGNPSRRISN